MLTPIQDITVNKLTTKQWLCENTNFKTPFTAAGPFKQEKLSAVLASLPQGKWVLKPCVGQVSAGIVLFERVNDVFRLFPDLEWGFVAEVAPLLLRRAQKRLISRAMRHASHDWFIEQWISPHIRLFPFTMAMSCPPIIRFSGCPEVHFIAICPMLELATGLAGAAWQDRKYAWLDLEGRIRRTSEMDLQGVDPGSVSVAHNKAWTNAPFDSIVAGIPALVEQINREVAGKIALRDGRSWSLDGTFNDSNDFVCIEMNSLPGLQFRGFSWAKGSPS
jgi:hypothetical protein